jgi:hypothetical protein
MPAPDALTPLQIQAAWRTAYRVSLDEHPDQEIRWEVGLWRTLDVPAIAALADALLAERHRDDFVLPGGADAASLDRLLAHLDLQPVLRLCRDEGLCLLAAMRLVFWTGLREVTP